MARPIKVDRPIEKKVCLPTSLVAAVELELYSELEGKVPFGAWQGYLIGLITKDLRERALARAARAAETFQPPEGGFSDEE